MIDLCVINYNTQQKLQRFLEYLHVEGKDGWKLHVADNGSQDSSVPWLQSMRDSYEIDSMFYNENIGYAGAANQLASMGTGDIIGILNADVWLSTRHVKGIQHSFDMNPEMAIMGPKQRDEKRNVTHGGIFGTNEAPTHRGWRCPDPNDDHFRDTVEAVTVSGSAYFVRRSVWNTLTECPKYRELYPDVTGAFLPTPHYYEETWCSYHARTHGFKVFYDGTVSIGHSWHASSPINGEADQHFPVSRAIFRTACDFHGISHD